MGRFETGNMWMKTTPYRIRCRYCGCKSWPSRDLTSEISELFPADRRTGRHDEADTFIKFLVTKGTENVFHHVAQANSFIWVGK